MTDFGNMFYGYQIIETPFMCDTVQAKKHKKKRINKKWKKRYGMKEIPKKEFLITNDGKIFGHPKMIEMLKNEIAKKDKGNLYGL